MKTNRISTAVCQAQKLCMRTSTPKDNHGQPSSAASCIGIRHALGWRWRDSIYFQEHRVAEAADEQDMSRDCECRGWNPDRREDSGGRDCESLERRP